MTVRTPLVWVGPVPVDVDVAVVVELPVTSVSGGLVATPPTVEVDAPPHATPHSPAAATASPIPRRYLMPTKP